MANRQESIECPQCFSGKNLSIHITASAGIRIPILKGIPIVDYEILWETLIPGVESLMKFSSIDRATRVVIHRDDIRCYIHCPSCKKMFKFDREIKCNVAK